MIKETTNDILRCPGNSLIVNQANVLGFGAAGLMARIRKEHKQMFDKYHELCGYFKTDNHQLELLGEIQALKFTDSTNILCNVFTQKFITETKYVVDMDSWRKVISTMIERIKYNEKNTSVRYDIHIPYKIGIGMKPEEVENVKALIEKMLEDTDIDLTYHI